MPATETVTAAQVASTAVATEPVIAESVAPAAPVIDALREPELAPKPEQPETPTTSAQLHPQAEAPVVEAIEPAPETIRATTQAPPPPPTRPARKPASTAPPERIVAEAAPAPTPGAATGNSGDTAAPDTGSGDQSAGGGQAGDRQDYLALLAAWLERHKEYPRRARARGEEGTVLLRFKIDRGGRLLMWRIDRSSGHPALDREVEAMLQRAEPLPPLPPEMTQAQLELAVPIQFRLR